MKNFVVLITVLLFVSNSYGQIICPANTKVHGTKPLVLVDSMPTNFENLRFLSPENIKDVTILKNAEATAVYGGEGVNGVIVIATKKSHRLLSMEQILKVNKADSLIGKPLVVLVNKMAIDDVKELRIDSSAIFSLRIRPLVAERSYQISISVKTLSSFKDEKGELQEGIMIRGNDFAIRKK